MNYMDGEYKYEVAFSFLSRDETLAQRLNDLLQDRVSTFIYPERQLELAGKDGELELKQAFGCDARIVVILYRKEWGTTPWTRIEQDAIRDRAYNQGYEFCILIPLEEPPTKPQWFPPHRFWVGLQRWGVDTAAAVIEARVQEAGGTTREESLADRKARLEREVLAVEKRKVFLESEGAVKQAVEESQKVLHTIQQLATSLSTDSFPLSVKPGHEGISITSYGFVLQSYWQLSYLNSLSGSGFYLRLLERDKEFHLEREFHELAKFEFNFAIDETERLGWRSSGREMKFYLSDQLADFALQLILDKVAALRKKNASEIR
jgi:hypothetical protein